VATGWRALWDEARIGARFCWGVPTYLRHPVSLPQARRVLHQRLERRAADFLHLVDRAVYGQPTSPYRHLLRLAGCEAGDLAHLVAQEGLEGALHALCRAGLYLTVDELKGRRAVVRGSTTLHVQPAECQNPLVTRCLVSHTSGSRGAATPAPIDLAHLRDRGIDTGLMLHARGGADWVHATWEMPCGSAIGRLLWLSAMGARAVRWFSPLDPAASSLHPRYRWGAQTLHWVSVLAGRPLPRPQYVPLDAPRPIVRWLVGVLERGRTPALHTVPSSAVRVCEAAVAAGVSLAGAWFVVVGEPLTDARLAAMREVGANAIPVYGAVEAGTIGYGCAEPTAPDEVHLLSDLLALIQPGSDGPSRGLHESALLLTTLRPTAPFILLNVSLGDVAEVATRACGCGLDALGWPTHLHTIRSPEKLTAAGLTLLDGDVIRVLEEVLPRRFGGQPTDYQLVEQEDAAGRSDWRLLVHPSVGALEEAAVAEAFLTALGATLGADSAAAHFLGRQGPEAALLQVERRPPLTARGKIQHVHSARGVAGPR
jgi:hypothetical protein